MKQLIIISYWIIAILLLSTIMMSLDYSFSESLFLSTIFLPGALTVKYLLPRISFSNRREAIKSIITATFGIVIAEISLLLFAYSIICEIRSGYDHYILSELPVILINPIFIVVIIVALSVGNYYIGIWIKKRFPSKKCSISFSSERKIITLQPEEILYVESNDSVTLVVATSDRKFRNKTPISQWAERLGDSFIRIHRSYIVNRKAITDIKGYT
ncbi:MAG: LytTR family DNA-binding domain-containing protein [Bacteroidales bacterium]|nr:LytTR family DNA-binding domain-containing protein [Bacteroidales bacterium]MDD4670790.1 LytTR family DNA-binding domain-containing protein [Bacteroidales bacterium]